MRHLIMAVLFGLVFCTPMVTSQTSGFSQQGKVTHDLKDEGFSIAHSSLPLNSKAKIANTSTGKEVEVTITRLIPASANRIADVSSKVWEELKLTPDTDARLYTMVSARPQVIASPTTSSQTTVSSTTASPAAKTAQTGTASDPLSNMPSSIKFENNNNFIINGVPVVPSAVTSETPQTQPAQPVVSNYETPQTQPAQPVVSNYETPRTQPAQPAVSNYETSRSKPAQPSAINDMWAQIIKPAAAPRTQQTQPGYHDTRPQQALPAALPAAPYTTRTQPAQPAMTYETSPGQPIVRIVNWPQTAQQPYEIRVQQASAIPEKPLPEIQTNRFNEIVAPLSRTFVFIDTSPESPVPSVTIDNGPQSYRSVPQEQGKDRNR